MFPKYSIDVPNIATLREYSANIPRILRASWDKFCFQHDRPYGDLKDLNRRTNDDKILLDKDFSIAKNLKIR